MVFVNVCCFNQEVTTPRARSFWSTRPFQFFVYDPALELFAPAKFAAFVPLPRPGRTGDALLPAMTTAYYAELDESDPRFDGHRARKHLTKHLCFRETTPLPGAPLARRFEAWRANLAGVIRVRGSYKILLPPGHSDPA